MIQPLELADRSDASPAIKQLLAGAVFTGLLFDATERRAAALETVLGAVVESGTRVAWVGNPLRSPLTIERFLIQIIGPEVDLRIERGPSETADLIASPIDDEQQLLVVVQQPETINPETRDLLSAMGGLLDGKRLQVQFLFVGTTAFELPTIITKAVVFPRIVLPPRPDEATARPRRYRDVAPILALLSTVVIGVMLTHANPDERVPAALSFMPASQAAPVRLTVPLVTPRATDLVTLRHEFDAFLAQRGGTLPVLTETQKNSLFGEFLARQRQE